MLDPAEARTLLDSIDVSTPIGLRARALIALTVFSFGRIGAALAMKVEDVFVQNRRLWGGYASKAASGTKCPAIIRWKPTCMLTWTALGSLTLAGTSAQSGYDRLGVES